MTRQSYARPASSAIALAAWTGLVVQAVVSYRLVGSVGATIWLLLAYFTILANVLVTVIFTRLAVGRRVADWVLAGSLLSIVLVGVTYALLLRDLVELSGGSAVANGLLHQVTPVAVPLYWLLFVAKGTLAWRDPLLWAIFPLAYLVYALVRGLASCSYAYPFLNVARLGWGRVGATALVIAVIFLGAAYGIVWADHRLARRVHP